jgi:hypothetical protein
MNFVGYGEHCWGFTACDGPGWAKRVVNGVEREFFEYIARCAPFGPDDGTDAPWVVVASLPFAPEIVIPTVRHFAQMDLGMTGRYGFKPSFNQSFAVENSPTGWWVTPYHFGIDQGPIVLNIENYRTGLLWNIMRRRRLLPDSSGRDLRAVGLILLQELFRSSLAFRTHPTCADLKTPSWRLGK